VNIELAKPTREAAIASLKQYVAENLPEPIGDLQAGLLLDYFVEEIGPAIYNQAIADAQTRMQMRVADLSGELFEDELQYWPRLAAKRKAAR
jgi:uncharacterized protein (DUF2164 family)